MTCGRQQVIQLSLDVLFEALKTSGISFMNYRVLDLINAWKLLLSETDYKDTAMDSIIKTARFCSNTFPDLLLIIDEEITQIVLSIINHPEAYIRASVLQCMNVIISTDIKQVMTNMNEPQNYYKLNENSIHRILLFDNEQFVRLAAMKLIETNIEISNFDLLNPTIKKALEDGDCEVRAQSLKCLSKILLKDGRIFFEWNLEGFISSMVPIFIINI